MDEGKRPGLQGFPMDDLSFNEMLGSVGRAGKDKHRGEGSTRGQENHTSVIEDSSSIAFRGGEPPANTGRDMEAVDSHRRAGRSVVREEDVQERNPQDGYDPDDDEDEDHSSLTKGMAEIFLGQGGSSASEGGEDEKRRGGSKRKSGWLDEETGEGSSNSNRNRRRKFGKKDLPPLPNPPTETPREFRDKINGLGGKVVTLIMQKVIRTLDVSRHTCRLSLPKSQLTGMDFLREGERRKPNERGEIPVRVIFPNLSEKELIFTVWGTRKKGESNAKKA